MKIKYYIITYNRKSDLNSTLESLFSTDINDHSVEVFVINNHSNFSIDRKFENKVSVLHNMTRPDFSTGHLARDYNSAIINGFKNLKTPDCDIVIHSHDDVLLDSKFFRKIIEHHKKYDLLSFSAGCSIVSYLPEAVKKIGIWDERFCATGYHEGDYFLRALYNHKDKVSINDREQADREYNPLPQIAFKLHVNNQSIEMQRSFTSYPACKQFWSIKYPTIGDVHWSKDQCEHMPKPVVPMFAMYPYFEKDIYDLDDKYFPGIIFHGQQFFSNYEYENFTHNFRVNTEA